MAVCGLGVHVNGRDFCRVFVLFNIDVLCPANAEAAPVLRLMLYDSQRATDGLCIRVI